MAHDIVIRGGTVVDGTGAGRFEADVAIDNGLISSVGAVTGRGADEIDARGKVVSPGFVDLHTHLDAQIGWDPDLTPVSWHGVTTALMGNCGVTFAPCKPSDREMLAAIMETVEDIPRRAILSGLPWTWEAYGGYLDALDQMRPGINVAGLVGHCAVRTYVMGERAVEEQASDAEKAQMAAIVAQAIDAGALGFSTNRYEPHKGPDGRSIPGTFADVSELEAIVAEVGKRGAVFQAVGALTSLLAELSDATGARILYSTGIGPQKGRGKTMSEWLDRAIGQRDMTPIIQVRGSGYMFGLQSGLPFKGETWARLRPLDLAGRLAAVRDPDTYARLRQEGDLDGAIPFEHLYYLGAGQTPDYAAAVLDNVAAVLARTGESFVDFFLRVALETEGRGLFNWRMFCQDLDELSDLLGGGRVLPSLGDAGAHVSQIMDAGWATFVLAYWVRARGLFSLEQGVRKISGEPARVLGLADRGVIAPGKRADINVFDPDQVVELQPELVNDFPGGAPRYIQKARGYAATLVNGRINLRDGEFTGARAGQVLRHRRN